MLCAEHILRTRRCRVHVYQQPRAMRLAEETLRNARHHGYDTRREANAHEASDSLD